MIDKNTYKVYQAIVALLATKEYKMSEIKLFGVVSRFLGENMRGYENGIKESASVDDNSGTEVQDSAEEA